MKTYYIVLAHCATARLVGTQTPKINPLGLRHDWQRDGERHVIDAGKINSPNSTLTLCGREAKPEQDGILPNSWIAASYLGETTRNDIPICPLCAQHLTSEEFRDLFNIEMPQDA